MRKNLATIFISLLVLSGGFALLSVATRPRLRARTFPLSDRR